MKRHLIPPSSRQRFRRRLVAWYRRNGRDLPWRRTRDPYRILVSEIMLQQTQVDRVQPKYEEWLHRYPTFEALAAAPVEEVTRAWYPLGYNIRPRRLHAIAREAVAKYDGRLPDDEETLRSFKGIGAYTAGAVLSFAFGRRAPILDTNVARVLFRVFVGRGDPRAHAMRRHLWNVSRTVLPHRHVYDFNQALMDLGATVCVARKPKCHECPVRTQCKSFGRLTPAVQQTDARRSATDVCRSGMYHVTGHMPQTVPDPSRAGPTYLTPDRCVSIDGVTLHYRASLKPGSTITLVMIHGLGASLESWCDVWPRLAAEFSVVRVDLKGSGYSSKPADGKYSSRDQATLLTRFIEAIGLGDVVLIGHSLGGAVALSTHLQTVGRKSSCRVVGLVLINSAGYRQKLPWYIRIIRNPIFRVIAFFISPWYIARFVLKRMFFVKSRVTKDRTDRYAYFFGLPGNLDAFIATARQIFPADAEIVERQYASIRVPTLIIWGAEDPAIPLSLAHRFHADIAGSELQVLEDTGHVPQEERPEVVADLISTFVACRRPIVVVAAVVERGGHFFVTRRHDGTHLEGYWEFPGGKVEPGETDEASLVREMREELDAGIEVRDLILSVSHTYPDRTVELHFHACDLVGPPPRPLLGQEMRWVTREELRTLQFPPADTELIELLAGGRG